MLVYIVSNLLTLGVAAVFVWKSGHLTYRIDIKLVSSLLVYGIKSHLSNISLSLNERLDQLLISALLVSTQLGLYVVAVTMATPVVMIGISIATVAFPAIAGAESSTEIKSQFSRYTRFTLWVSITAAGALSILCTPLLKILFY